MNDLSQLSDQQLIEELQSALGGGASPSPSPAASPNMVVSSVNRGGVNLENLNVDAQKKQMETQASLDLERQKKGMEGAGPGEAGRVTLAQEALKSIQDVKSKLFPDGTPESFNRMLALASNLPQLKLPGIGPVTPQAEPDIPGVGFDNQAASNAQSVNRETNTALMGRQLIQTGVAARPDETQALHDQFAPKFTGAAKSTFEGLTQLEDFYKGFLGNVDPQGAKGAKPKEVTGVTKNGVTWRQVG